MMWFWLLVSKEQVPRGQDDLTYVPKSPQSETLMCTLVYTLFFLFLQDSCSGRTPLHYAVEAENFQLCNFLLENNCNVNATTFAGECQ